MNALTDIAGYEGLYAVSSDGEIWAYPKKSRSIGRWLKQNTTRCGYRYVCLFKDGKRKNKNVHQMVAMAFVEGHANGLQVNHIDGNKAHNGCKNLEWVTPSENRKHSYKIGTSACGPKFRAMASRFITAYNKSPAGRERARINAIKMNELRLLSKQSNNFQSV